MAALNEKYLKKLDEIKEHAAKEGRPTAAARGNLKEKIETAGPSYFS